MAGLCTQPTSIRRLSIKAKAQSTWPEGSTPSHLNRKSPSNDKGEGPSTVLHTQFGAPSQLHFVKAQRTRQLYDHYPTTPRLTPLIVKSTVPLKYSRQNIRSNSKRKGYRTVSKLPKSNLAIQLFRGRERSMNIQQSLPRDLSLNRIPISHGFGDGKQRAERCRDTLHERHENVESILRGLTGELMPGDTLVPKRRKAGGWCIPSPSSPGSGPLIGSSKRSHIRRGRGADYSTQTSSTESIDLSQSLSSSPTPVVQELEILEKSVTRGWASEDWNPEGWKDVWSDKDKDKTGKNKGDPEDKMSVELSRKTTRRVRRRIFSPTFTGKSRTCSPPLLKTDPTPLDFPPPYNRSKLIEILFAGHFGDYDLIDSQKAGILRNNATPLLQDLPVKRRRTQVRKALLLSRPFVSDVLAALLKNAKSKKAPDEVAVTDDDSHERDISSWMAAQKRRQALSHILSVSTSDPAPSAPGIKKLSLRDKVIKNTLRSRMVARMKRNRNMDDGTRTINNVRAERMLETLRSMIIKPTEFQVPDNVVMGILQCLPSAENILQDVVPPHGDWPIPRLAHGLDRALFNQTVHWLQDPHSRVFNFPPALQHMPHVTEFAFERLPKFTPSSQDEDLQSLAVKHSKQFIGTTSSLTRILAHIYLLLSDDRKVDISTLSMAFASRSRNFTPGLRCPHTFTLRRRMHHFDNRTDTPASEQPDISSLKDSCDVVKANNTSGSDEIRTLEQIDTSGLETKPSTPKESHGFDCKVHTADLIETREEGSDISHTPASLETVIGTVQIKASKREVHLKSDPLWTGEMISSKLPNQTASTRRFHTTYAIETGFPDDTRRDMDLNVLLWLGTMTEKFLTFSPEQFNHFLRKNPAPEASSKVKEAYRYTKSSKFIMRSQLDCQDSRLPGSGVFDVKTRAVLPIRMDRLNIEENSGYLIRSITGYLESFEREYYDLIRSAFLKYNFQARIGGMDGMFVAYHNTARIFGFQYIPVKEMEARLYGPDKPERGARIFEKCVGMMEVLMEEVVACFPGNSLTCIINKKLAMDKLFVWVTPEKQFTDQTPVKELVLTISHLIDGTPVSAERAIDEANGKWTVNYKIHRSTRPQGTILKDIRQAQAAAEFKDFLPPGVSAEQARHGLAAVDWGAGLGIQWDPEDRVSVMTPDEHVEEVSVKASDEGEKDMGNAVADATTNSGTTITKSAVPSVDDTSSNTNTNDTSNSTSTTENIRALSKKFTSSTPAMIRRLRALSKQGKADTLKEQAEGAKQVVWGVDHDERSPHTKPPSSS